MWKKYLLSLLLVCGSLPSLASDDDPWEGWNRSVFAFNEVADTYVMRPIAAGYRYITPDFVDTGVSNFFSNLGEPFVVVNDLLQFKLIQALSDTGRFLVNSTIGLVGLFDVASHIGLVKHNEDLGQTFGYWGVDSGPYLMLPFFGPSTVRDASGFATTFVAPVTDLDPLGYVDDELTYWSLQGLKYTDIRADIIPQEDMISGDRYSFIRNLYLQRRAYLVDDAHSLDGFADEEFESEDDNWGED
jgi:phospholipid-binding lipoprotein MlaA